MTVKAINERLEFETTIHDTARQFVELIAVAKAKVKQLRGRRLRTENIGNGELR
jgi:hypothetical protein